MRIVRDIPEKTERKRHYKTWKAENYAGVAPQDASTPELLRRAVVGLLRTGVWRPAESGSTSSESDETTDWMHVLWPLTVSYDKETYLRAYAAWSLRMAVDLAVGTAVQRSADFILRMPPTNLRKAGRVLYAMELALSECSDGNLHAVRR